MNPSKDNLSSSKYDSWLHSKMSTFDVNHIWKIDKFKELSSNYKELSSSVFSAHDIELRVCMQVLNERELISDKSIDMCLECFPGKSVTGDISVDYRISILKNDGDVGIFKSKYQTRFIFILTIVIFSVQSFQKLLVKVTSASLSTLLYILLLRIQATTIWLISINWMFVSRFASKVVCFFHFLKNFYLGQSLLQPAFTSLIYWNLQSQWDGLFL